ncbi:MAG: heavy-metal-associated domain-containing protein [Bacteroidales bacterium]|jgi:copper chaperone CopZ|nr:heavy-metal-associated domain-containing protein [Bacteroidales bacterium]
MKKLLRITFSLLMVMFLSFQLSAQEAKIASKKKDGEITKIKVDFHCRNGKKLIDTKLVEFNGIKNVDADLKTKVVTIQYDPTVVKPEGIVSYIEEIGYYTEHSDRTKKIERACSHGEDGHSHDHDHDHDH